MEIDPTAKPSPTGAPVSGPSAEDEIDRLQAKLAATESARDVIWRQYEEASEKLAAAQEWRRRAGELLAEADAELLTALSRNAADVKMRIHALLASESAAKGEA